MGRLRWGMAHPHRGTVTGSTVKSLPSTEHDGAAGLDRDLGSGQERQAHEAFPHVSLPAGAGDDLRILRSQTVEFAQVGIRGHVKLLRQFSTFLSQNIRGSDPSAR